ncbi:hypothetical protein PLICRDRAFT_39144 [Plicaturopsis crispa FD-325 SS-3]|nr:hypothetical protein PLICRDRAFT_39144 [Plicaturopsis crispa FD-325 SS-3]
MTPFVPPPCLIMLFPSFPRSAASHLREFERVIDATIEGLGLADEKSGPIPIDNR